MTPSELLATFETFAEAPTGAERLRELIISLAVQGKLIPQNSADEPASLLLEKIHAEKLSHANGRGSHRAFPKPTATPGPIAQIPPGWCATQIGVVAEIVRGITFPSSAKAKELGKGHIACLRTANIQDRIEWDDLLYIPEKYVRNENQNLRPQDIVMSMANSRELVGKVAIADALPSAACFGGFLSVIRPYLLEPRYLMLVLRSPNIRESLIGRATQTTNIANISLGKLCPQVMLLPPLAEQRRIVAKTDELMALIDKLESARATRETSRAALRDSALAALGNAKNADELQSAWRRISEQFNECFGSPSDIASLRQTILQLAFRGLLATSNPNDKPASELLKAVLTQIPSRSKPASPVNGSAVPFALPANWAWARFPDLGKFGRGKSKHRPRNHPGLFSGGKFPFIQTGDVARSQGTIKTFTRLYNEKGLAQSELWPKGTLCITIAANIADSGILDFDSCFPDSVVGFSPTPMLGSARYFEYFMRTAKSNLERFAPSTAQRNINLEILKEVLIPIPPLEELNRIVTKVDAMMKMCDQLESALTVMESAQEAFAAAASHHLAV